MENVRCSNSRGMIYITSKTKNFLPMYLLYSYCSYINKTLVVNPVYITVYLKNFLLQIILQYYFIFIYLTMIPQQDNTCRQAWTALKLERLYVHTYSIIGFYEYTFSFFTFLFLLSKKGGTYT